MKNKTLIGSLSVALIALLLFFSNRCGNVTLQDLESSVLQIQHSRDSLNKEVKRLLVVNKHIIVENEELKEINKQLSELAKKKQQVKTVTRYTLTLEAKRLIESQKDSLLTYQQKMDSLNYVLSKVEEDTTQVALLSRINQLEEALRFCTTQDPAYTHFYEDDYLTFSSLSYPDSIKFSLIHADSISSYQTKQRNGFLSLGRTTYNTFVTSQSPYSTVKDLMVYQREERRKPFSVGLHLGVGPTWELSNFSLESPKLGIQAGVSLQYSLFRL